MNGMKRWRALLACAVMMLATGTTVAQADTAAAIRDINAKAAALNNASPADRAAAEQALLDSVRQAASAAVDGQEIQQIVVTAIRVSPQRMAVDIAAAAVDAKPFMRQMIVDTALLVTTSERWRGLQALNNPRRGGEQQTRQPTNGQPTFRSPQRDNLPPHPQPQYLDEQPMGGASPS